MAVRAACNFGKQAASDAGIPIFVYEFHRSRLAPGGGLRDSL
jgi:hypothetical protein